jgi:hypothetical protein
LAVQRLAPGARPAGRLNKAGNPGNLGFSPP